MKVSPGYREFVLDQLERVTPVTARSMFGGVGIYSGDAFFAIIADDRLFFKVDDTNRPDFEREGSEPFRPYEDRPPMKGYFEVPVHVLEHADDLAEWVEKSLWVARKPKAGRKRA